MKNSTKIDMHFVKKGWGFERWIVNNEKCQIIAATISW